MTSVAPAETESLDIWSLFHEIGYQPHPGQQDVHASEARFRVVSAGRRFGKSAIGGNELVAEAFQTMSQLQMLEALGKRREFWIVGPEYSDSEKEFRVAYNTLKRLGFDFDHPGTYYNAEAGNLHLSMFDGLFQIHGKSAKYPETLQGEGLNGVILAEAAKLKLRVWSKFVRPMLSDYQGWAFFSSTPEGKNWFYELWKAGQNPLLTEWDSWRKPAWANPYVYPGGENDYEIISMRDDPNMTSESFNQEIAADFTEFVGRVFKEFDEETHVGDFGLRLKGYGWHRYAAVDYGFTNPFVWLVIDESPWGDLKVVAEYYERGKTIAQVASELESMGLLKGVERFYPDPASPGDSVDLSERTRIPYKYGDTGGPLRDRLDAIRGALSTGSGMLDQYEDTTPKLMIDRSCLNTIREFNDYRYPDVKGKKDTNEPENPQKKDDHTPEALGRFFAGHFKARTADEPRQTRVRRASMSRGQGRRR